MFIARLSSAILMALRSTRCRGSRQKFSRDICRLVMAFAREVPSGHAALCGPRVAPLNLIPATPRLEWPALHHGPRCNYDSARHTDPNIPYTRWHDTYNWNNLWMTQRDHSFRGFVSVSIWRWRDNRVLWGGMRILKIKFYLSIHRFWYRILALSSCCNDI